MKTRLIALALTVMSLGLFGQANTANAFLLPEGKSLPFVPKGKVFGVR